jgi:hypothetical protein
MYDLSSVLYANLPYPLNNYNICPCCGTEFGNDDAFLTHEELRYFWIASGAQWHSHVLLPPAGWDAVAQLIEGVFDNGLLNESAPAGQLFNRLYEFA